MESIIDEDDTCESDMLGTTPPRARIRNKEKKRSLIELNKKSSGKTTKDLSNYENNQEKTNELSWSSKAARNTERDAKKDLEHVQAESLNVNAEDEIEYRARSPTLVESCNRFMCLTSKLKCQSSSQESALSFPENCLEQWDYNEDVPNYRVDFHRTFSMLIKMGNNDRNCKRALSVEEQVWENERKDLIWLELRAKIAGRSLQEQDNFLCSQRLAIPTVINNILDYRFKNQLNCHGLNGDGLCFNNESISGCVRITCVCCAKETSVALKEVGTLLESYHAVQSLYPSTKAMAEHHPIIAEERYENRLKAMCLWYNIAYNMRCKLVGMRKMLKFLEWRAKSRHRTYHNTLSSDSGIDQSKKLTQVKFDLAEDGNAHDSNNSTNSSSSSNDNTKENSDSLNNSVTPPLNQQGSPHATSDTTISSESGYNSDKVDNAKVVCYECDESFSVYDFNAVTQLRLLGNCTVSPYRVYINDVLKTQGLRKALMFIDKVQSGLAKRALLTFEKYNINKRYSSDENAVGNLGTATKSSFEYEDEINSIELRRFGSWSEETQNMRLPSYRSTFMLLATICMEVIYDYLEMRVECQPEKPNCMSIKQLIHELKEGLDIATEHRSLFLRNVNVALDGYEQTGESYEYFKNIVDKFDATVHKVLDKYFSYLTSWASMEHMSRALLDNEWAFTTKLASRMESLNQQTPQVFGNLAVIQIEAMIKRFSEKMWQTKRNIENKVEDVEPSEKRYQVYALCREVQKVFMCERELMLQTIQFSRSLSTVLRKKTEYIELREKLFEALMSSRDCLDQHLQGIIEKSDPSNFPEEAFNPDHNYIPIRIREVLLQGLKFGFEFHRELHRFIQDPHLARYRKENLSQTSSTESDGGRIRPKLSRGQSITESFDNFHPPQDSEPQSAFSKSSTSFGDTIDCSSNGRLDSDDVRRREQQWAVSVSRAIIDFATKWMKFVMSRCERGRGLRPRWANQGLEFLMLACDPRNTKHLTDNEFNDLKSKMDLCISHVIGSRGTNAASSPAIPTSPVPPPRRSNHRKYSNGGFESPMTPPTPGSILSLSSSSDHVVVSMKLPDETRHSERVLHALDRLERSRETLLMKRGRIGRVVTRNDGATTPKLRQVTFRWQRGIKIGQGSFGKVYTVVDTESGQLMAMKEVALCRGDRKAVQRAANELKVLEGITHPHLVRYYGCEIHQEEMLLFMELCVEGSLDALVARADGGLPEPTIRRYTKQLVAAIMALHNAHIVHRDIKSGNIFLTNEERCLKLGDFGCAVKIRGNTTAAGELIGHVGTQAYMAPEVFMKSSGHGRAADIWSLGCVVTEMASGKRPFSEYDNNYQIMFLVGMEGRPEIPERLSNEGKNFTLTCLTHDPEHRPTALELADHHFLKVKSDDDCNCDNNFKTPLYK